MKVMSKKFVSIASFPKCIIW